MHCAASAKCRLAYTLPSARPERVQPASLQPRAPADVLLPHDAPRGAVPQILWARLPGQDTAVIRLSCGGTRMSCLVLDGLGPEDAGVAT